MTWARIPKAEIHLHLEGAAPPAFIRAIAAEQGAHLDGVFDRAGHYQWRDFADFLDCYQRATSVLTAPDHFRRLVEAVLRQSAAQGVVYTEIFIAPHVADGHDPGAWVDRLAAMEAGADAVPEVETRFIAIAIRNLGPESAVEAARLAAEHATPRLTGFGMAGEERYLTVVDFAPAFAMAREAGLGLTCHAGELMGPESVKDALDILGVTRLGHGVRAIEDPALVDRLAAENIVLEVNLGSNLALGLYPDLASHPVTRLRDAGVRVTLSTDDPPYFHTSLSAEYEALARHHGWKRSDFDAANRNAMEAAFCDDETRRRILARIESETG